MSSTLIANTGLGHPADLFIKAPNYINTATLGSTGVILPIPAGAANVRVVANIDCYLCWGSSGADTAAHTTGLGSELVPYGQEIYRKLSTLGTTMVSAASTAAGVVSLSWWTI